MLDRKALAHSLHDLHASDIKSGHDDAALKKAIVTILEAIDTTSSGLSEDDSRHLAEAIDALAGGHHFLARSSLLLILEGAAAPEREGHHPPLSLAQLTDKMAALAV